MKRFVLILAVFLAVAGGSTAIIYDAAAAPTPIVTGVDPGGGGATPYGPCYEPWRIAFLYDGEHDGANVPYSYYQCIPAPYGGPYSWRWWKVAGT